MYLDELFELRKRIKRRKITEYEMQLAIIQNPHISDDDERKKIWDALDRAKSDTLETEKEPEFDEMGFAIFKSQFGAKSGVKV